MEGDDGQGLVVVPFGAWKLLAVRVDLALPGVTPPESRCQLRHTGNTLAARTGASLADLMARMGHDSSQAAMIYQHKSREADRAIAQALNTTMKKIKKKSRGPKAYRSRKGRGKPDDGTAGVLAGVS